MQKLTEQLIRLSPPGGFCDRTVVSNLFPDASEGARKQLIHRAASAGEILRLKRGLFLLDKVFRKSDLHPFALAALLHSPSHISLETALWHHGLIPEALYQVSSVTVSRSRSFSTPVRRLLLRPGSIHQPRRRSRGDPAAKRGVGVHRLPPARPCRCRVPAPGDRLEAGWSGLLHRVPADRGGGSFRYLLCPDSRKICDAVRNRRTRAYLEGLEKAVNHVS